MTGDRNALGVICRVFLAGCVLSLGFLLGAREARREREELRSLASSLASIATREAETGESARTFVDGLRRVSEGRFTLTGYTATDDCPGPWCDGWTASMTRPQEGRTIACPRHLAFGTIVFIDKLGPFVCEDRGGKIKGKRLDVYFDERTDALVFGKKPGVPVIVLN